MTKAKLSSAPIANGLPSAGLPFANLPFGGRLEQRLHRLPVRVYYEDTDAAGIVYHASYLRYAERGRTEMLRAMGLELSHLREETGLVFVLHSAELKFRKPARLDDELVVETALVNAGAASIGVRQRVLNVPASEEIMRFDGLLALTGRDGKPARLPRPVRDKIEAFVGEVC